MIRDLPYKGGWRFGDEKRCLEGTREDFLEHITKVGRESELEAWARSSRPSGHRKVFDCA
jgi:hypothetical protein